MHDRRNVVVMFLLIMLSFAIISEVSAVSDAEADGTGSNLSMKSADMANKDIACERFGDGDIQNHDDDFGFDFKSHDEQKSFDKTPGDSGDNRSNENLYKHKMDIKPEDDGRLDNNTGFDMFKPPVNESFDMKHKFDEPNGLMDNKSIPPQNGDLMDDVVSKLIGMNNISPNFKNNQKSPLNDKNNNESAPMDHGDKNSSDLGNDDIKKKSKVVKKSDKKHKKAKTTKKTSKKVKYHKKAKKANKNLAKKSIKERAKL